MTLLTVLIVLNTNHSVQWTDSHLRLEERGFNQNLTQGESTQLPNAHAFTNRHNLECLPPTNSRLSGQRASCEEKDKHGQHAHTERKR